MPVARIVTSRPQDAEFFAGEMRARGYTVEIVFPGARTRGHADLEIDLETSDPEEALRRAGELAEKGADVFVSAGTFAIADPAPSQLHTIAAAEPPVRTVWQPTPEPARSSVVRELTGLAGSTIGAMLQQTRDITVAGAKRARELMSSAMRGARTITRNAAAALAVHLARRSEQQQRARQQRQLRQAERQRTLALAALPSAKSSQPVRLPVIRRTRSRDYEWKTAGVFSLALAVGITLAWAAANRRPATPVPASVVMRSNAMQQQVPFGPVTLPPPAKALQQTLKKPKRSARKAADGARHESDTSGKEVVVRHFTPARTQPPSRPSVAVRRIVVNE